MAILNDLSGLKTTTKGIDKMETTKVKTRVKKVRPKEHRRMVTCWLQWKISPEGVKTVEILYWRKVIFYVDVVRHVAKLSPSNIAAKWWGAESACRDWARNKGFEVMKEKLNG